MVTMITKTILFATALLGVLMTCGLITLLGFGLLRPLPYANYPTRTAAPPVPIYPDAQNVAHVQTPNARTYRVTTFDTTATPEAIYDYYDEQLPQQEAQGWRPYDAVGVQSGREYAAIGCTKSFFLSLDAVQDQGITHVTLKATSEGWCY
jgi:hypothetical protein